MENKKERQSEVVQIKIKVTKECNTCEHICFQEDWNTAKCIFTNEIVIENYEDSDKTNMKEPCEKWSFDYNLFNDTDAWFVEKGEENND